MAEKLVDLVVFELKRTADGGHVDLQAIRYAAMVSAMSFDDARRCFSGISARWIRKMMHGNAAGVPGQG